MAHCYKSLYLAALHVSVCKGNVCLEELLLFHCCGSSIYFYGSFNFLLILVYLTMNFSN